MEGRNGIYGSWLVAELTDRGTSPDRPQNEDAVRHMVHPRLADRILAVVADGMGGAQGGTQASRIAVDTVCRRFVQDGARQDLDTLLEEMGQEAHQRVASVANDDPALKGAGTTLVMAIVDGDRFHMAHVGDSRAYLLRGSELTQLTEDHSLVRKLIESGQLTEEAAETDERRHILSQAVGRGSQITVEVGAAVRAQPGDRYLLCSDGLYSAIDEAQIGRALAREVAPRVVDTLMQASLANQAEDNVTVQVLELATPAALAEAKQFEAPTPKKTPRSAAAGRVASRRNRPAATDEAKPGFRPTLRLTVAAGLLVGVGLAAIAWFALRGPSESEQADQTGTAQESPAPAPPSEVSEVAPPPVEREPDGAPGESPLGLEPPESAATPAPQARRPTPRSTPRTPAHGTAEEGSIVEGVPTEPEGGTARVTSATGSDDPPLDEPDDSSPAEAEPAPAESTAADAGSETTEDPTPEETPEPKEAGNSLLGGTKKKSGR